MINMLRVLMENRQHERQMDNLSREVEILRKNQNKMLENKKYCNRNEEGFDRLNSRLGMAKERSLTLKI